MVLLIVPNSGIESSYPFPLPLRHVYFRRLKQPLELSNDFKNVRTIEQLHDLGSWRRVVIDLGECDDSGGWMEGEHPHKNTKGSRLARGNCHRWPVEARASYACRYQLSGLKIRHLILLPVLLATIVLTVDAQIVALGACPKMPKFADLHPERYGGLWYEQEKYPFIFELGGKCITAEYSLSADNTITVVNRQISTITGGEQKIYGSARKVGPSKLLVKFPMSFNIEAPYEVIDTDYSNYAVVYSCNDLGLVHTTVVWILTRDRFPSLDVMLKAYYAMDRVKLNRALLTRTDQQHCESPDKKYVHVSVPVKIARH